MNIVLSKINQILMEKYLKLQDTCRTQVRSRSPWIAPLAPPGPRLSRGCWVRGLGARSEGKRGDVCQPRQSQEVAEGREGRGLVVRMVGLQGLKGLFQPQ